MDIHVAIVEDDARYRAGLEALLGAAPGFVAAASFPSARQAVAVAEERASRRQPLLWDVVLMDLDTPGMSGIEATRRIKALAPDLPIVVVTVFEEPSILLDAIRAGADGYLLKRTPGAQILEQVRVVLAGGSTLTPVMARSLLDLVRGGGPVTAPAPTRLDLTDREQEVLRGLVHGLAYKEIADSLGISLDTVRTYIRRLYKKLAVQNAAGAVTRAVREGLV